MLRAAIVAGLPARLATKRPQAVTVAARVALTSTEVRSPLLRCGRVPVPGRRVCLCSAAADDSGSEAESSAAEGEEAARGEEGEGENVSAIVPAVLRPEDCHTVIALPLLQRPLFPGFYMPVYVKDAKLLRTLDENSKKSTPYAGAFLVKNEEDNSIHELKGKELLNCLHDVGTLAQITRIQGDLVVLLGHHRIQISEIVVDEPLTVKVDHLKELPYDKDAVVIKATSFEVISTLKDALRTNSLWKDQVQAYTQHMGDFNYPRLADLGAAISGANKLLCQEVLEELDVCKRLKLTLELVKRELEISKLQESIAKTIEEKITREQRRYLLNELLKAIKKELGLETDDKTTLSEKFRGRIEAKKDRCPPHVLQVMDEELTKLQLLEASSSEFSVTRNYLDWLTVLPWGDYSDENFDVHHAQHILDEDHYGLADVKERILEFIAVGKLRGSSQGKIICLSGPPGVGKTSIGRSIARALNRKFYRFSVGGLADVAEIKGHRRTYVGAMPGKIVQCLRSVGTANPLVLIDEIDKLGKGHSGDPASALLELFDPEQNANFLDHYLDAPVDLSKVLFVCTANVIEMIPSPLLDRMEIIAIAGYITDEKMHIARNYLEKKTREACGIKPEQVEVTNDALLALIENYCREAGVRNLQQQIEKIYRNIALKLVRQGVSNESPQDIMVVEAEKNPVNFDVATKVEDKNSKNSIAEDASVDVSPIDSSLDNINVVPLTTESEVGHNEHSNEAPTKTFAEETAKLPNTFKTPEANNESTHRNMEVLVDKPEEKVVVNASNLGNFVGKPVFQAERIYNQTPVGVVMGLAWNAMGGSTLYIETAKVEESKGKGTLFVTGQLGDVMKESAQIAHTVCRAVLLEKEPNNPFFAKSKLHLHVPAGATPKDGPSAGCTMVTSMLSLAIGKSVKKDLAMTGEVTLTGRILPIGGVKEKTIAARRSGVKTIIFPSANRRDFDELASNVKEGLEVHFVDKYSEIYDLVFTSDTKTQES
ncbi:lon protease homolog, mitochondrial-like isoform X1 [Zea mays]|uniref:lon protease homolog, mitochondrial-like isoform X1 n=1 Tax=Zea mays TaxID=4577 RepID=UPI0004DEBDCD|nr:lon protease homolog, mitochondrial-like isoform X1 [Zea mays]|eukprot:XP_008654838.1 lon protease homolog, mitochondrial-like isoform X1 [Zea mays]